MQEAPTQRRARGPQEGQAAQPASGACSVASALPPHPPLPFSPHPSPCRAGGSECLLGTCFRAGVKARVCPPLSRGDTKFWQNLQLLQEPSQLTLIKISMSQESETSVTCPGTHLARQGHFPKAWRLGWPLDRKSERDLPRNSEIKSTPHAQPKCPAHSYTRSHSG